MQKHLYKITGILVLVLLAYANTVAAELSRSADIAAPQTGPISQYFLNRHAKILAQEGRQRSIDLLFIGDSITTHWEQDPSWQSYFGKYNAADFGVDADRTENLLWRIEHGELDHITPKVVVLLIGTNNIGDSAEETYRGIHKIVQEIHHKLPKSQLLLMGIFPCFTQEKSPDAIKNAARIRAVNAMLAKLDDGRQTRFMDIGSQFLDKDGVVPKEIMPDDLHLSSKGYRIWADAIKKTLEAMMKQ